MDERESIDIFHRLYYERGFQGGTWKNTTWLGVETEKLPLDLWIYQEILFLVKPDVIIECGTFMGGSALFLASICDLLSTGRILTIDVRDLPGRPLHPRIEYVAGNSVSPEIAKSVVKKILPTEKVLVILDSNHSKEHVLLEMNLYAPLVSLDSYLIVEDGNINGHPIFEAYGEGPAEAIEEFLRMNDTFHVDRSKEKLLLTFNPGGYLRKVNGGGGR